VPISSPEKPARRVAGSWRETQEKQQFYSFGTAASLLPAESGLPKTVAQFAAAHLSGRIANRGLLCQAKRLPDAITSLSANAAPAKGKFCYFDRRKWIGKPQNAAQPSQNHT
jgi:hypothetical protein